MSKLIITVDRFGNVMSVRSDVANLEHVEVKVAYEEYLTRGDPTLILKTAQIKDESDNLPFTLFKDY